MPDRLFAQFDVKGNGLIDLDEFVTGLSICSRCVTAAWTLFNLTCSI